MATIFEYLLNEAASGRVPTLAEDSGPYSADLSVHYETDQLVWASTTAGNCLDFAAIETLARLSGAIGSDLATKLTGLTRCSFVIKSNYGNAAASYPFTPYIMITSADGTTTKLTLHFSGLSGNPVGLQFGSVGLDVGYVSNGFFVVSIDTTQANIADRYRVYGYNGGDVADVTPTLADVDLPQNTALPSFAATDLLGVGNSPLGQNLSGAGQLNFVGMYDVSLSLAQADTILNALAVDDDASPLALPGIGFVSAPAIVPGTLNSSGCQIRFTMNQAVTVKMLDTAAGSANPGSAAFESEPVIGTPAGYEVFTTTITGQAPSTTRRKWFRIANAVTSIHVSVDVTTTAASNNIIAVNNNQPIRHGQTNIPITWDVAPGTLDPVDINGVAQTGHTAVNSTTTQITGPLEWPLVMCGQTATLTTGSKTATTPPFLPPVGHTYVTLSGYTEIPGQTPDVTTMLGDPAAVAVDGEQFVIHAQGGELTQDAQGRFSFGSGFDGIVSIAIVTLDGVFSPFASLYYGESADTVPTLPALSNLINQEPNTAILGSFACAGVDAGHDITFTAVGSMAVATSASGPWLPSITRQLGEMVHHRMITALPGNSVTGGITSGGQSTSCTYTTRAAIVPTITSHVQSQSVIAGAAASFDFTATNGPVVQWEELISGTWTAIPGATTKPFVIASTLLTDNGRQFRARVSSPENGVAYSPASGGATLTVSATATKIVTQPLHSLTNPDTALVTTSIRYRVKNLSGTIIVADTSALTDSTGRLQVVGNLGAVGATVYLEILLPLEGDSSYQGFRITVEAV